MARKETGKTQPTSKSKPANGRTLTHKDREKLQRLLNTAELGKVRLAIELTEETCSDADLADVYTDEIILSLVSSGDIELFAITASFFLRHNEHWGRFLQSASETTVLTGVALKLIDTDLDDFTAITAEAAAMLSSSYRWRTNLDGIKKLSVGVAQHLAGVSSLSLMGIHSLPDDIAAALAEHKEGELILGGLTELSDAAAESLGKHQGNSLNLNGLTELSDAASESLSKHKGEQLHLSGLTSLSDAACESLSRHRGELSLDGLTSLSVSAAESLGKHEGTAGLSLQGLVNLSDAAAIALDNKSLQLPSQITKQINAIIKKIATTESLLTREQQSKIRKLIKTNDVDNLAVACELLTVASASEGDWIKLFPKTRIKELLNTWEPGIWNTLATAMKEFPRVAEQLSIQAANRFNTYPSQWDVRRGLEQSRGAILINANDDVIELLGATRESSLDISTEELSDTEAETLAKYKGYLQLPNLTELGDGPGHIALCEKLSRQEDDANNNLYLNGLTALSDAAAASLSKHKGFHLCLGLTSLSDAAAESLSKHKGCLNLNGVTSLSEEAAESLSTYRGDALSLGSLTRLSDAAAKSLSQIEPKFNGWEISLDNLPASAAKILRDAGHGK